MDNTAQVQSFVEDAREILTISPVPSLPPNSESRSWKMSLYKPSSVKLAKLANRNDLFQNNSDFELLTKALKYTFFFFYYKENWPGNNE